MPRLPTREDLGGLPTIAPGRGVATADLTGFGRGLAGFGADIARASAVLQEGWEAGERTDLERRYQLFAFEEERRLDGMMQGVQPGQAKGFASGWEASHKEKLKEFWTGVPGHLQDEYEAKTLNWFRRVYPSAIEFERGEQERFAVNSLNDMVTGAIAPRLGVEMGSDKSDIEKRQALQREQAAFEEAVRASGLNPIQQDEILRQGRANIQLQAAGSLDPESRLMLDPADRGRDMVEQVQGMAGELGVEFPVSRDSIDAASDLLDEAGFGSSPRNIALVHMVGPEQALKLLTADPNEQAAKVDPKAAKALPGVFYLEEEDGSPSPYSRTVADVLAYAEARMAGVRPVEWGDEFTDLTPEQKVAIAVDGARALVQLEEAKRKAAAEAYEQQRNGLENAILDGTAGLADIERAYDGGQGWLTNAKHRTQLINLYEGQHKKQIARTRAFSKIMAAGQGQYDPLGDPEREDDAKAAYDAVVEQVESVGNDGMPAEADGWSFSTEDTARTVYSGNAGTAQDMMRIVETFQHAPPNMVADLTEALHGDASMRDNAYQVAMRLYRDFPQIMRTAMTEEDMERLLLVDFAMTHLPEGEERENLLKTSDDPQVLARRDELFKFGKQEAAKIEIDDVLENFAPGFFAQVGATFTGDFLGTTPTPLGEYELGRFEDQWQMLAATFYARTGSWDQAQARATEMMQQSWHVSEVGSQPYLTEYPPELQTDVYPSINGNHEWAAQQVEEMALSIDPNAEGWGLVKIPQTGQIVRHNRAAAKHPTLKPEPVPYGLVIIGEHGGFRPVLDETGQMQAFWLDSEGAIEQHRSMIEAEQFSRENYEQSLGQTPTNMQALRRQQMLESGDPLVTGPVIEGPE